jgi:hypothetical protein
MSKSLWVFCFTVFIHLCHEVSGIQRVFSYVVQQDLTLFDLVVFCRELLKVLCLGCHTRSLTGIIDDYFEGYYSEKMVEAQVINHWAFHIQVGY